MTKSNRIQHLNSVAQKYVFLRRLEGQKHPTSETQTFFYIGTDTFAACLYHMTIHKEGMNKKDGLTYYVSLPYYLRMTFELFLFAKTLDETLAREILLMINDHVRYGKDSLFCLKSIHELFDLGSFIDIHRVCKFESKFDDRIISELSCSNFKTVTTVKREEATKCLTMQGPLQMKFYSCYQPLVLEMEMDMISNSVISKEPMT